jgi:hypothetical protein
MMSTRTFLMVLLFAAASTVGAGQDGVPEPVPAAVPKTTANQPQPESIDTVPPAEASEPAAAEADLIGPPEPLPETSPAAPEAEEAIDAFVILGQQIEPGELRQFNWQLEPAMAGLAVPTPVLVAHGRKPGPTLCLVAAVHGAELNGVEIVRRIMFDLSVDKLAGSVVGLPIANAFGFLRSSRYLPDRRDLNRYFPGTVDGSMAARFARALFTEVITRCNVLVDIHTGSFHRTNLPQLRADLTIGPVLNLTKQFGDIAVLHSMSPSGSLRRAATDVGIAAVTLETGGPARFQTSAVEAGVKAIEALINHLDMIKRFRPFGEPQPVFYESTWVRAESGGILLADVGLGTIVAKGQRLGTVTDPIENRREIIEAPFRGRILGMAVNQVVMPGFAAFHVGRVASERMAIESPTAEDGQPDTDHQEFGEIFSSEDEFFDGPADTTDEPEPEEPSEFRSAAMVAEQAVEPVEPDTGFTDETLPAGKAELPSAAGAPGPDIDPGFPAFDWPLEMDEGHQRDCIRPPLTHCQ